MPASDLSCDVLVIGGGGPRIAGATAPRRAAAQNPPLQPYAFLRRPASAAWVGTVCGLYLRDAAGAEAVPVSGGFAQEFAGRLQQASAAKPLRVDSGLWVLPYHPPDFARVANAIVSEVKNV